MTAKQTALYWREWAAVRRACMARAWPVPERHELHTRALGAMKSSRAFNNADFDRVLAEFRAISRPKSVADQVRQLEQPETRHRHGLGSVLKCITLYHPDAEGYAREVIRDLVDRGSLRNVTEIEDLSDHPRCHVDGEGRLVEGPSQLECLRMTLSARLNGMRGAAGDTVHEMKIKAGLPCRCATHCRRPAPSAAPARALAARE